jgi:hypothetical protein
MNELYSASESNSPPKKDSRISLESEDGNSIFENAAETGY